MTTERYEQVTADRRVLVWDDERRGERRVTEIKCCGEWLSCEHFTNTCDRCGADYNFSGQRLAPRSQWGEETGEHWSECY